MSPIAKINSAVRTILGTSNTTSRTRHRRGDVEATAVIGPPRPEMKSLSYRRRPASTAGVDPGLGRDDKDVGTTTYARTAGRRSHLGRDDFFPHLGELRLVGGPDLVLREPAEGLDVGGIDRHPLGFEQL